MTYLHTTVVPGHSAVIHSKQLISGHNHFSRMGSRICRAQDVFHPNAVRERIGLILVVVHCRLIITVMVTPHRLYSSRQDQGRAG